jgi:hypothetical protein
LRCDARELDPLYAMHHAADAIFEMERPTAVGQRTGPSGRPTLPLKKVVVPARTVDNVSGDSKIVRKDMAKSALSTF